ncbi:unnamed protein product [Taenia asiatica]|uniref:Transmembrane protein n=1 Tax=Taenia asiatica TaxID=60517 RepID=A0A0R3W3W5_TAEAS|nr:unnamed protein product [Taenia asiatica]
MMASCQTSHVVPPIVPSSSAQPKVGCCRKVSLCCCSCCFAVSVILAVGFFVSGGFLVCMNKDSDNLIEGVRDLLSNDFQQIESRDMWRGIGISLLVFGGIMSLFIIITGAFVCCLTPRKHTVPPSVYVVTSPPTSVGVPACSQLPQTDLNSSTYSKATAPLLEPPPDYAPPSYESVAASKVS